MPSRKIAHFCFLVTNLGLLAKYTVSVLNVSVLVAL